MCSQLETYCCPSMIDFFTYKVYTTGIFFLKHIYNAAPQHDSLVTEVSASIASATTDSKCFSATLVSILDCVTSTITGAGVLSFSLRNTNVCDLNLDNLILCCNTYTFTPPHGKPMQTVFLAQTGRLSTTSFGPFTSPKDISLWPEQVLGILWHITFLYS